MGIYRQKWGHHVNAHTKIETPFFCQPVGITETEEELHHSLNPLSGLLYFCLLLWKDPSAGLVEAEVQRGVFSHCEPWWPDASETVRWVWTEGNIEDKHESFTGICIGKVNRLSFDFKWTLKHVCLRAGEIPSSAHLRYACIPSPEPHSGPRQRPLGVPGAFNTFSYFGRHLPHQSRLFLGFRGQKTQTSFGWSQD